MSRSSSKRSKESGNTKQTPPARKWCFTLNNWTKEELALLVAKFQFQQDKYIIGQEKGEEGTPHLQGYVHFKVKCRPLSLGLTKRIHWEKCKGSELQNIEYCSKDGKYDTNFPFVPEPLKILKDDELYKWQKDIVDIVKEKPDDRTIHWFWEPDGNVGKTTFAKYLVAKYGAVCVAGKGNDILYVAAENNSKLYIFDLVRSKEQYISYEAMEQIKNGLFMSGKYEGKMIARNSPHIICFANFEPAKEKLSKDRWYIKKLPKKVKKYNSDSDTD